MTDDSFQCAFCETSPDHPFVCDECGHVFCADHYDPAAHRCQQPTLELTLSNGSMYTLPVDGWRKRLIAWYQQQSVFSGSLGSIVLASPVTSFLLLLMWVWFPFQFGVLAMLGVENLNVWSAYFVLDSAHMEYVWTWVTSIITHGGFMHLFVNSLVLAMFGPFVERTLGPRRYLALFLCGGILAGLVQTGAAALVGDQMQVAGASGAIAAVLGVHATVEPDVRVYLFFILPLSLWLGITVLVVGSIVAPLVGGLGVFSVAHLAHATGALVGVVYGLHRDASTVQAHLAGVRAYWQRLLPL